MDIHYTSVSPSDLFLYHVEEPLDKHKIFGGQTPPGKNAYVLLLELLEGKKSLKDLIKIIYGEPRPASKSSTVFRPLKRLVQQGLVKKNTRYSLTNPGKKIAKFLKEIREK